MNHTTAIIIMFCLSSITANMFFVVYALLRIAKALEN